MGSGPLRAKARVEKELFEKLGYAEDAARGVLVLEGRDAADRRRGGVGGAEGGRCAERHHVRRRADGEPRREAFRSSRASIETGLHKMDTLGFDVTRVVSAIGTAPLPPVAKNDLRAIGRTNDCVLYGGQARYTVRGDDDELAQLAERLPSSTSPDYGTPFYDIFKRYDNDFYKIDPMLFSPAEVWLTSATSGRTFHAGAPTSTSCGHRSSEADDARRDPECAHRLAHRRIDAAR